MNLNIKYTILCFFILGITSLSAQSNLEKELSYLKKQQQIQDEKIASKKITPVMFKRLNRMGIDSSKFNLSEFKQRKQIILLIETSRSKHVFLGNGIAFSLIGTSLMGLGGFNIYNSRNQQEGFGTAIGMLSFALGTCFNAGSIPFYIAAKKKHTKFLAIKQNLIDFNGF